MRRALILAIVGACSRHVSPPRAELVGNPLGDWRASPDEAFARSLWDLQAFDGKLFLGYGDAVVNTGPTDVISFDPKSGAFTHEATLPEEAIYTYRMLDGQLYVPGVDAQDPVDGAVYRRIGSDWQTIKLPQVVHASDVICHGDKLCVAIQGRESGGAVRCTRDDGGTWSELSTDSWRAVSLFELGGDLYVSSQGGIRRVLDDHTEAVTMPLPKEAVVSRPVACGGDVAVIAKNVRFVENTPIITVFGAYAIHSPSDVAPIAVEGTPVDLFSSGDACFLVTSHSEGGHNIARIYRRSTDRAWRVIATATTDAPAQSGELLDGFYYLGLGCDEGRCTSAAGTLVRLRAAK